MKSKSVTLVDDKKSSGSATRKKTATSAEKKWVGRRVKVEIFHCDGHSDEMILNFPLWTWWGEPGELACIHLKRLICDLSRHYIAPVKIRSWTGSVADDGTEEFLGPMEFIIPEGKVYVKGKWMTPEEINKMSVQERYS